ncbi:MAG: hypothetical protein ABJF04_04770 [Reichenbachiella sp.]|uniref:hypothetical protein n=1 Tax=Reichenbachiella sp. TaxID=2184521 RepID=UPI0032633E87
MQLFALTFSILWIWIIRGIQNETRESNRSNLELTIASPANAIVANTKNNHGIITVYTEAGSRLTFKNPSNYEYEPASFLDFVKPGDRITKDSDNDTILVWRSEQSYLFVNGRTLNYP